MRRWVRVSSVVRGSIPKKGRPEMQDQKVGDGKGGWGWRKPLGVGGAGLLEKVKSGGDEWPIRAGRN